MGIFICLNPQCNSTFSSRHSNAKYCSRKCAGTINQRAALIEVKYSDDFLIEQLRLKAAELNRTPTKREMKSPFPSCDTYARRFGSYNKAVILAGLTPFIPFPSDFNTVERNISVSLRYKILKRDSFTCQYCGGTPQDGYVLHVDHIVPKSAGGLDKENNLITACWHCNQGKSNF